MKMSLLPATLVVFFVLGACKPSDSERPTSPASTGQTLGQTGQNPSAQESKGQTAVGVPQEVPTLQEAAEQLLVDWETAQDAGDFDAYQALYAEKFTGVKRVGHRASTFNREGWLSDRGRMFQNTMRVTVEAPDVALTGNTAVVRFTQRWESGTFADLGAKVLVLQAGTQGLKIVREEMLESNVLGEADRQFDPNRWVPVVYDQFLVLTDSVEPSWLTETHRLLGESPMKGSVALAETRVNVARLPLVYKQLEGRTFDLFGTTTCRATVQGFRVLAHVQPHFGTVQDWDSREKSKEGSNQIAAEIVDLASQEGRFLVARLDTTCTGADWGQAVKASGDLELQAADEDVFRKQVMEAAAKTKVWEKLEADAQEFGKTEWVTDDDIKIHVMEARNRRFAVMSFQVGVGCNEFYGEFSAIFDVTGASPVLIQSNGEGPFFAPHVVLFRDGQFVFISDDRAAVLDQNRLQHVLSWSPPYLDCPC